MSGLCYNGNPLRLKFGNASDSDHPWHVEALRMSAGHCQTLIRACHHMRILQSVCKRPQSGCSGVQPKARFLYSLAFYSTGDASNALLSDDDVGANDGRMLIFGGEGRDGCYMNDVWEFSLSSSRWREVSADRPCQKHCLHKKDKPESEEQDESMFNAQLAMQEVRKVLRQV